MKHISEDDLLRQVLEALDDTEPHAGITDHLASCAECQGRLHGVQRDVDMLGGLRPYRRVLRVPGPAPRRNVVNQILRVAALVIAGVVAGFGASRLSDHTPVPVVPAYVELAPPLEESMGYAVTDATGVPAAYDDELPAGIR